MNQGSVEQPLSQSEISQLMLGSSLSGTKPLVGLIKFLIAEKIVDAKRLRMFLEPLLLVDDNLPPATRAMLDPLWKSFLAQISDIDGAASK